MEISGTQLCAVTFIVGQAALSGPPAKADSYNNGQFGLSLPPLVAPYSESWLAAQQEAARNATFFAACNYYTYLAQKS